MTNEVSFHEYLMHVKINVKGNVLVINGEDQWSRNLPRAFTKTDVEDAVYRLCQKYDIDILSPNNVTSLVNEAVGFYYENKRQAQAQAAKAEEHTLKVNAHKSPTSWKELMGYEEDDETPTDAEIRDFLVTEVMRRLRLKSLRDTEEVLFYHGGCYRRGGEQAIREILHEIAGSLITNYLRNETIAAIRASAAIDRSGFDSHENTLNLKDGIHDLVSRTFKKHPSDRPSPTETTQDSPYLSMVQLPVAYDPKAACRDVVEFLFDVIADPTDVPLLLEYMGYCLLKNKELQKELLLVGPPDCGKSVLLFLFTALLGSRNVSNVTMQQLSTNRFAKAQLEGKLANIFADISHARLQDIEDFKAIATADELEVEKKGMQLHKMKPTAKIILSANIPPRPPITVDDSYYRRWMIIQCSLREKHYFTGTPLIKDPQLIKRLTTPENLSGLLNLVLVSARRLIKKQRFCKQVPTAEIRELYDRLSNPVQMWIDENCEEVDDESFIEVDIAYKNYLEFCKARRVGATTKEWVGKELQRLGHSTEQKRTSNGKKRVWLGLVLKNDVTRNPPFPSLIQDTNNTICDTVAKGKGPLRVTSLEVSS